MACQAVFFGRVQYTHVGGIDEPVAVSKSGVATFVPQRSWQGTVVDGTNIYGSAATSFSFPGRQQGLYLAPDSRLAAILPNAWYGSLLDGGADASGLIYMRNRYYDPAAGQFTQQDPIGLAGGMNLYGFAGGDPVNSSDPFGLCPYASNHTTNVNDCPNDNLGNAFRLLKQEGGQEGASTIRLVAANEAGIKLLTQGQLDKTCQMSPATGCNVGKTIYMRAGQSDVDYATRSTHEATHFFGRPYSQEEPLAWRRALTVFGKLEGALPSSQTAGSWYKQRSAGCKAGTVQANYCP